MRIVIASGKGGTGKTTIATSLFYSMDGQANIRYVDCDVEAPNGHLSLRPEFLETVDASMPVPQIQAQLCSHCGRCVDVCQYHALAKITDTILVFSQLCHGCGSCAANCPANAIIEQPYIIGKLERGRVANGSSFYQGSLLISEPMATPVIHQLKRFAGSNPLGMDILDAPPGASCSVVETLQSADFALLVTEPTPFGLHDLKQMVSVVREMRIPFGVVINRDGIGDSELDDFCTAEGLPVLMRIPFERQIAEYLAQGKTLFDVSGQYLFAFQKLAVEIHRQVMDKAVPEAEKQVLRS